MRSDAALAWRQYRLERKMFWRNPSAAFFNFLLPLLFLGLFGAILSGNKAQLQILVPGIAGMAVMSTTFNALAFNITVSGHLLFGLDWPQDWFSLWLFVIVGVICFASLGVALSHAIPNFDAAPAYVNAAFLPMIFISGV